MKKFLTIIASAAILVSCADFLSLSPADQIASENMWANESLAEQGIAGLYQNFYISTSSTSRTYLRYSDGVEGINRQGWAGLEFQTYWCHSNLYELTDATKTAGSVCVRYEWEWAYTAIHRINDAIQNLHKAGLSEDKYESYMCEARFLRAWYYYYLNKIYHGVPLYLEPVDMVDCTKTQSTSAEVWDVVLDDLNYCLESEYCPDNTISSNYGRPSKGAAYSLRGQVYMWLAWENGEDKDYYQLAANDFEKVAECGYGLWAGNYIDFFNYQNEKDHEMIFPIQYSDDAGYCDFLQMLTGSRDQYQGWSMLRPSTTFVNYFQNADGSKFEWSSRIPEWDDDVFINDFTKREVFFMRDSITVENGTVLGDYWDVTQRGQIQERVDAIGLYVWEKYYLKDGNEDRLRSVYNDRDPRLKDIVLTPYDSYDTYYSGYNNGENMYGKEIRWPFLLDAHKDGKDIYFGNYQPNMYLYKKYTYHLKDEIPDRLRCPTDWPLIRYTDIYLYLAECYVYLGRLGDAISIVNEIRSRAKMPSVSVGSYDEVMEAVRYERRVELCLEGQDWFDEWRWGTYKEMKFEGNDVFGEQNWWGEWDGFIHIWYYDDIMFPWPAPATECNRNHNLVRADGWSYSIIY